MINKKLIHFNTYSAFEANKSLLYDWTIAFIGETKQIYTHGNFYDCNITNIVALQEELERIESAIPTKVSQLENDKNYISEYMTYYLNTVASNWVASSTHALYPYQCDIECPAAKTNRPAHVIFNTQLSISDVYAPVCSTLDGTIRIFGKKTDSITIPTIIVYL